MDAAVMVVKLENAVLAVVAMDAVMIQIVVAKQN
tara:strand:+ start:447 stop:548 length:102 start_codon:yes stop_codon:yes gene_type:complete